MNQRTENIEAFLRVVEIGSVSGAARSMNLSKSVASKRLSDLEHGIELGGESLANASGSRP